MTRDELIGVMAEAIIRADDGDPAVIPDWAVAEYGLMAEAALKAQEDALARTFKRVSDPRQENPCTAREHHECLGIVSYCRLEMGHEGGHATESAGRYHFVVWERA